MTKRIFFKLLAAVITIYTLGCDSSQKLKIVDVENATLKYNLTSDEIITGQNYTIDDNGLSLGFDELPSYGIIECDIQNINELNISFWLNVKGEKQYKPQIIFSLIDTLKPSHQFSIWMAGHRITGAIIGKNLWAKDYNYKLGTSRSYYDLFQLEQGKYYFFSMNFDKNNLQIYINAERYTSYENLEMDAISFQKIILGVEKRDEKYDKQLLGYIRNLTLFERVLTVDEIYSLSVKSYSEIEKYNREFELSKFNF